MNLTSQEYLARLLAKENLTIQHGNYSTASFDTENRILRLPLWEDKGKAVYDLLVGHEVGHALYTPNEGLHSALSEGDIPKPYLNIVEDIRIERMIQETYPGIVKAFRAGYKRLFDDNLFGTNDREPTSLMDRLNVHSKGRGLFPVEFDDEESPLVKEAMEVKTWEDVVVVCKKLKEFLDARCEEEEEAMGVGDMGESESEEIEDSSADSGSGPSEEESEESEEESESEGGESGSESSEEEGEGEGEESEESSAGSSGGEELVEKATDTFTEETFRKNEEELLDIKPDRYGRKRQSRFTSGMSESSIEGAVYGYKEVMDAREEELDYESSEGCYMTNRELSEKWLTIKKKLDSTASLLAKDFERKKAAYEYSRATVAKKGSLNPNKLHQYKYSEDIFLTTTRLAQAKSHGIVSFIDMSGSMCEIIEDVVCQAMTIAMFCKKVNIPFRFYTFTSRWTSVDDRDEEAKPTEIENTNSLKICEVLSNEMKSSEFKLALKGLYGTACVNGYRGYGRGGVWLDRRNATRFDEMGTTPLVQTTIVAASIVKKFQRKYNVQKTNIMMLTDGYADSINVNVDGDLSVDSYKTTMRFGGKMIHGESSRELYQECLKRLREITGAKITGFFLASKPRDMYHGIWGVEWGKQFKGDDKAIRKEWNKNNIVSFKDAIGYDDYFVVKVGDGYHGDDEFTLPEDKTHEIKDIRNAFKKHSQTKKKAKMLVNKISEAVAV